MSADDLLQSVRLFDVSRGQGSEEGTRSLAFRLSFVSPMWTLTDEELEELRGTPAGMTRGACGRRE
jgi:phenylalanyl-tRNA synthetase beta subunit